MIVLLYAILFLLDIVHCQLGSKCPEVGLPLETCEDKCDVNQDTCVLAQRKCCLVECGKKCINPQKYDTGKPVFKSHSPSYGPLSGGTQIVMTGNFSTVQQVLSAEISPRQDKEFLQGKVILQVISRNFTHIILQTVGTQEFYLGVVMWISVECVTQHYIWTVDTDMQFVYKEDPTITDIFPRSAFITGGIALTAVGQNLDSVANPVMLVHMERRRVDSNNNYFVVSRFTFRAEKTFVYNTTAIVGITPVINTSASNQFTTGLNSRGQVARKRRQATSIPDTDPWDPINNDTLEFFIGFELDGVQRYENLSQAIDEETGRLRVFVEPSIERYSETKLFNPNTESELVIKGARLRLGASLTDYMVSLGSGICEMRDLNDNAVLCAPPQSEPKLMSGSTHELKVSVGYLLFNVGRVQYVNDNTQIYIIAGCVAGAVVLILLIVGLSVLCCRKTNPTTKS